MNKLLKYTFQFLPSGKFVGVHCEDWCKNLFLMFKNEEKANIELPFFTLPVILI